MIGRLLIGRYLILKKMGLGGFSETYLAVDKYLPGQPLCVVKHLKPLPDSTLSLEQAQQAFESEARLLNRLGQSNPHIPRLLAYFHEQGQVYQVSEYIRGENLEDWFVRKRCLSARTITDLLRQVLLILKFVHHEQVIHQDVKPSNLIRQADGSVTLIDFGAACDLSERQLQFDAPCQKRIAIGTAGYMSDEQQKGYSQFNSDLYALGVSMIQFLVGIPPHQLSLNLTSGELDWQRHLKQVPVDAELVAILQKMVRQDYRTRFQSADQVLAALQSLPVSNKSADRQQQGVGSISREPKSILQRISRPVIAVLSVGAVGGCFLFAADLKTMLRTRSVNRFADISFSLIHLR